MDKPICKIDGCERPSRARGWCSAHYARWVRTRKTPSGDIPLRARNPEEAFLARTEWRGGCLVWTGKLNSAGYGRIRSGGVAMRAHRFAWEQVHGPIPDGMLVDHLCFNAACVNVDHLRLATRAENTRYRSGPTVENKSTGIRNVTFDSERNKYLVQVSRMGRNHFYGRFDEIDEAAKIAARAREELFGEFAGKG